MPRPLFGLLVLTTLAASYWLPPQELYNVDDDYCSTGPPGIYCQSDLLGYYDCRINPQTGTYNNKTYTCKAGTRYTLRIIFKVVFSWVWNKSPSPHLLIFWEQSSQAVLIANPRFIIFEPRVLRKSENSPKNWILRKNDDKDLCFTDHLYNNSYTLYFCHYLIFLIITLIFCYMLYYISIKPVLWWQFQLHSTN